MDEEEDVVVRLAVEVAEGNQPFNRQGWRRSSMHFIHLCFSMATVNIASAPTSQAPSKATRKSI